jgi:hypothetical protein
VRRRTLLTLPSRTNSAAPTCTDARRVPRPSRAGPSGGRAGRDHDHAREWRRWYLAVIVCVWMVVEREYQPAHQADWSHTLRDALHVHEASLALRRSGRSVIGHCSNCRCGVSRLRGSQLDHRLWQLAPSDRFELRSPHQLVHGDRRRQHGTYGNEDQQVPDRREVAGYSVGECPGVRLGGRSALRISAARRGGQFA